MARAYISVGTNIDRECNLRSALRALSEHFSSLTLSSVYESEAVGFRGPAFYNMVVGIDTDLEAMQIVGVLKQIEAAHGRTARQQGYAARTLDLDLLLYDDLVVSGTDLQLPRDEIMRHAFVLKPLAEIAGDVVHPVVKRRLGSLWAEFDASQEKTRAIRFELSST